MLIALNRTDTIISVVVIIDRVSVSVSANVTVNGCNMFDVTFVLKLKVLGLKATTRNP